MNDNEIEQEIQSKALTASRVTLADLEANIADTEIVKHVSKTGQVLRWAIITTQNGYAAVGKPSVAVSPENDNAEIGEKIAIDNTRNELWPLMGYALKERLAGEESARQRPALGAAYPGYSTLQPHQQRVIDEKCELDARLAKLLSFFGTPIFAGLPKDERLRLEHQEEAMQAYSVVLAERIAAF